MTHTPLPWHQHQDYASVRDATGRCVADCGSRSAKIAQEATRLIVRAVNCHDELLAACREAMSWLREYHTQMGSPMDEGVFGLTDQLEDAIAKAGENQ